MDECRGRNVNEVNGVNELLEDVKSRNLTGPVKLNEVPLKLNEVPYAVQQLQSMIAILADEVEMLKGKLLPVVNTSAELPIKSNGESECLTSLGGQLNQVVSRLNAQIDDIRGLINSIEL